MFRFAEPEYLYLLLVVPLLTLIFVFYRIRKRKNIAAFGDPDLLEGLMPNVSTVRPTVKFIMQMVVLMLLVVVLARPQFGTKAEEVKRQGIEVMIALDISNSMMATDVAPNRLAKSKQILSQLIDNMSNDKVGLVVFAGDAFTQLPITADYVSAKMFLSTISPKLIARQGTAIGSAVDLAIKSFNPKSPASKAIILITDGENHEDNAVEAARLAQKEGIVVHVIGMGRPEGAPIPVDGTMSFWKDKDGNVVVSKLNEVMCNDIASAGQGVYVRADNTNAALRAVSNELDQLAKTELTTTTFSNYNEQFQSFAIIALVLLLMDIFVLERINKRFSRLKIFDLKEKL
ncbi:MAG: VWA domain-containing protein [Paludibacter sp.]|nr:VWA domain-containing protein [Paludibacter sp.]MDD4426800.1 VWA domain-containing protein [Paludibacter sp.]